MKARSLAALPALALALAASSSAAHGQTTRSHTVRQILLDGRDVAFATGVTVKAKGAPAQTTIRRNEPIADGTRVDVPAHVVVVIASTGNKSRATLEPGASITFVSTDKGEILRSNAGKTLFDVVHNSLDFFRVQYGDQITAGVSGTAFSIDARGTTVIVACTSDQVSVAKTGYLQIGTQRKKVTLFDTIVAGQKPVSYHPSQTWTLGTFTTYAEAENAFRDQLASARTSGNRNAESTTLKNIGNVQEGQGQYAAALQSYQQSLAIKRELGDRDGEARALSGIGIVQADQRQYAAALQSFQQAFALFRELGDRDGEANALNNIGSVQAYQRQYAAALKFYQQSLAIKRELGDRDGEAHSLDGIGNVQEDQGQDAAALQSHRQALALDLELGDRDSEAGTLNDIGWVQEHQGQYAAALQSYQHALAIYRQIGVLGTNVDWTVNSIARVRGRLGAPASSSPQPAGTP